jgi:predicted lipid-binding transport protein (Tim44 family)
LNLRAFAEDWLDAYDKQDKERYFSAQPQPQLQQQPSQQAVGGQASPGGVTAPQASQADTSPSHQASLSPETFLQRAGAATGGAVNQ